MKITYLHQYFNTLQMSGGTRSYEMGRRLVEMGHEVHVVTSWREPSEEAGWHTTQEAGMTVHWLHVPYSNRMSYRSRLWSFVRFAAGSAHRASSLDSDVILATSTPLTIAIPGAYASRRRGIPMVFEVRDLWPDVPIAMGALQNRLAIWAAKRLEHFAYTSSERVVALAPGMQQGVCDTGFPANRTAIIPNGADRSLFETGDSDALADRFPWLRGRTLVTYAGTLGLANGVEYIVELAAAIEEQEPSSPIVFAVLGDGSRFDGVRDLAAERGVLGSRVHLLGALPKEDVPHWIAASAATIMTYDGPEVVFRDSVSNKFFDSLAAGKPVLANFRGFSVAVAELHGAGCILPRTVGAAAERCRGLLADDDWLTTSSRAARSLAAEVFDRDELARDLETVLAAAVAAMAPSEEIVGERFARMWQRVSRSGDSIDR